MESGGIPLPTSNGNLIAHYGIQQNPISHPRKSFWWNPVQCANTSGTVEPHYLLGEIPLADQEDQKYVIITPHKSAS